MQEPHRTKGSGSVENRLLDVFDRARDGLRETFYRWDNRLLRQELSFPEHYLNGRFAFVCQFSSLIGGVMVFVSHRQPVQVNSVNYGHKGNVLVPDIQVVDCKEEVIPSFVWPYRVENEVPDALGDGLYWSAIQSTYKTIPVPVKRETRIVGWPPSEVSYEFVPNKVEGRPEVVENVPDNGGKIVWGVVREGNVNRVLTGTVIKLDGRRLQAEEGVDSPFKLVDVLVGPFDL